MILTDNFLEKQRLHPAFVSGDINSQSLRQSTSARRLAVNLSGAVSSKTTQEGFRCSTRQDNFFDYMPDYVCLLNASCGNGKDSIIQGC
jgi:hypothetical protein